MATFSSKPDEVFSQLYRTSESADRKLSPMLPTPVEPSPAAPERKKVRQPRAKKSVSGKSGAGAIARVFSTLFCLSWFGILLFGTYPLVLEMAHEDLGANPWYYRYSGFIAATLLWLAFSCGVSCAGKSADVVRRGGHVAIGAILGQTLLFLVAAVTLGAFGVVVIEENDPMLQAAVIDISYKVVLAYPILTVAQLVHAARRRRAHSGGQA